MDDQNTQSEPVAETPVQTLEPVLAPVESESSQPNGSTPTDLPPVTPESPINAPTPVPVEDQNGAVNEPESKPVEPPKEPQTEAVSASPVQPPISAPTTSVASQPQSLAQQDQSGFIRNLLIKAQAKIQFNKQKKLEKLMEFAQKERMVTNSDVQRLLRVSDRTATRYLVKLVQQGRLLRVGDPRDAKYQFVR